MKPMIDPSMNRWSTLFCAFIFFLVPVSPVINLAMDNPLLISVAIIISFCTLIIVPLAIVLWKCFKIFNTLERGWMKDDATKDQYIEIDKACKSGFKKATIIMFGAPFSPLVFFIIPPTEISVDMFLLSTIISFLFFFALIRLTRASILNGKAKMYKVLLSRRDLTGEQVEKIKENIDEVSKRLADLKTRSRKRYGGMVGSCIGCCSVLPIALALTIFPWYGAWVLLALMGIAMVPYCILGFKVFTRKHEIFQLKKRMEFLNLVLEGWKPDAT